MREILNAFKFLIIESGKNWAKDKAPRLAAALSFYAMLALAPMLILAVTIAGHVLKAGTLRERVMLEVTSVLGQDAATFLNDIIMQLIEPTASITATLISISIAVFASSNIFIQLRDAVNSMWALDLKGNPIKMFLTNRFLAVLMVLGFILLIIAWIVFDSWLGWIARKAGGVGSVYQSLLSSIIFLTIVFALSFKSMPRGMLKWKDVWIGAFITAIGVSLSKFLLSTYFAFSGLSSAYGSAGALVLILLWIYYTAQIYFFGIEITYTYAHEFGSRAEANQTGTNNDQ